MAIRRTIAVLWRFNSFSKWQPSAILDSLCARLDHPRQVFGGIYHCAKFGWNRCISFDNMQVLIFNEFGLKKPISSDKMVVGGFYSLNGEQSYRDPKRHLLVQKDVIRRTVIVH